MAICGVAVRVCMHVGTSVCCVLQSIPIKSLWEDKTVVIFFLRRFG